MLVALQIKHIVPNIHIIYVIVAHEMEMLTKCLTGDGFFIPINNGHDSENLTFGKSNRFSIFVVFDVSVFVFVFVSVGVHQYELIELTSF